MSQESATNALKWPFSLSSEVCDPFAYDVALYRERLELQSERLFSSSEETRIKVLQLGSENHTFSGASNFQDYLKDDNSNFEGIRIILIPQFYSWGKLMISELAMEALLDSLGAFPPIFDMIEAFGERTGPSNESLGGCQVVRGKGNKRSFEACFLLKHVEEHGREERGDRWSIRQMGVYLKIDETDRPTFIIVNPSKPLQQRLKLAQQASTQEACLEDIVTLLLSCSSARWRSNINEIEEQLTLLKSKANEAVVSSADRTGRDLTIDFGDSQDLRVIGDKLLRLDHILETNLKVYEDLALLLRARQQDVLSGPDAFSGDRIEISIMETKLQRNRVSSLLKRMRSSSELMQNIIAARGLYALQENGQATTGIMKLAQADNKIMIRFSRKAQNDARVLRTITILTMVYLPASFVAQMLSMGYITIHTKGADISLDIRGEMVIFAVLTILLLIITGGIWGILEWRRRSREQKRQSMDSEAHLELDAVWEKEIGH